MSLLFKCIKNGWILATKKGGRIRMTFAFALLTFAAMLPFSVAVYLDSTIFGYSIATKPIEYLLVYGLIILLNIFMVAPVSAAFFSYTFELYSKARYGAVYRKKKRGVYGYFRNLFGGLLLTLRGAVCAVVLQGAYALTRYLETLIGIEMIGFPMLIIGAPLMTVALGFCFLFLWITGGMFLMPYYFARGEGIFASFFKSYKTLRAHPFLKDGYALIFSVLTALSMLTLGILFALWVMPLMMFTYFTLADHLDGGKLLEE